MYIAIERSSLERIILRDSGGSSVLKLKNEREKVFRGWLYSIIIKA